MAPGMAHGQKLSGLPSFSLFSPFRGIATPRVLQTLLRVQSVLCSGFVNERDVHHRAEQMVVFGGSNRTLCHSQITVPNHCIPHAPRHKIVWLQTSFLTISAHNRPHRSRRSRHCTLKFQMRKRAQTASRKLHLREGLFMPGGSTLRGKTPTI